ncbi:MAG: hypothetical protein ABJN84_03195 [Flavobacteriaceae bacterium]
MTINNKIEIVSKILDLARNANDHSNRKDIRYVSTHIFALTIQNYLITLILSRNLSNLDYLKNNIYEGYEEEDIADLEYNFGGYQTNALLINLFVYLENHIRQIANHYETDSRTLNVNSITNTFKNIINRDKLELFANHITNEDLKLFEFFCYVRNTMHNGGFHSHPDASINITDSESIFGNTTKSITLEQNQPNRISFEKQWILYEQIVKLVIKLNSIIPQTEFIEHRFVQTGFNKEELN